MNAQMNAATLATDTRLPMFGIGAAIASFALVASIFSAMMVL